MPTPHEIMEAEKRRFEEKAAEVARDMADLERILLKYNLMVVPGPEDQIPEITEPSRAEKSPFSKAARDAEAIIRAAGHPFSIGELMRILTVERGMKLENKQAANMLAARMATHNHLEYIRDVGWWIKGVPWPPTPEDIEKLKSGDLYKPPRAHKTWEEAGPSGRTGPRRSPERQHLLDTVRSVLKDRKEPMKFGELYDRVKEAGAVIGGKNEKQNLSIFLAKYSCFKTEGRRGGWYYIPERDFELQDTSPSDPETDP